jgi:hypothetical protein
MQWDRLAAVRWICVLFRLEVLPWRRRDVPRDPVSTIHTGSMLLQGSRWGSFSLCFFSFVVYLKTLLVSQTVQSWMVGWLTWPRPGKIPEFAWKGWRKLRRTSVRTAGVLAARFETSTPRIQGCSVTTTFCSCSNINAGREVGSGGQSPAFHLGDPGLSPS